MHQERKEIYYTYCIQYGSKSCYLPSFDAHLRVLAAGQDNVQVHGTGQHIRWRVFCNR